MAEPETVRRFLEQLISLHNDQRGENARASSIAVTNSCGTHPMEEVFDLFVRS